MQDVDQGFGGGSAGERPAIEAGNVRGSGQSLDTVQQEGLALGPQCGDERGDVGQDKDLRPEQADLLQMTRGGYGSDPKLFRMVPSDSCSARAKSSPRPWPPLPRTVTPNQFCSTSLNLYQLATS